jgi:hypothetical protein
MTWLLANWQVIAGVGGVLAAALGGLIAWLRGRASAQDDAEQAGLHQAMAAERAADKGESDVRAQMAACDSMADAHARVMCKIGVAERTAASAGGRDPER